MFLVVLTFTQNLHYFLYILLPINLILVIGSYKVSRYQIQFMPIGS